MITTHTPGTWEAVDNLVRTRRTPDGRGGLLVAERAAREVLAQIADGSALPDALLLRVLELQAEDRSGAYVPPTPRVRAFLRTIQKRLEAIR